MIQSPPGKHRARGWIQPALSRGRHRAVAHHLWESWAKSRLPEGIADPGHEARRSLAVLAGLLFVYVASTELLVYLPNAELYTYVGLPILWGGLAAVAHRERQRLNDRANASRLLVGLAATTGVLQVAIVVLVGFVAGFGHSPYASNLLAVGGNLLYLAALLLGVESTRAYLYEAWRPVLRGHAVTAVALLMAAIQVPLARYAGMTSVPSALETTGGQLLPALSESVVATFFVMVAGPAAAVAYRGTVEIFEWLSPILPNFDWALAALMGTAAPIVALAVVRRTAPEEADIQVEDDAEPRGVSVSSVLVGFLLVSLIWLNVGMFGVVPSVVLGQSMEPSYHTGDLVYVEQVTAEDLSVGDVVKFTVGNEPVVHRIIEIAGEGESPVFVTQGDNNNTADAPIVAAQIDGRVAFSVPKIGWLQIWIKRLTTS